MKNKFLKVISLLMSLVLIFSMFSIAAFAAEVKQQAVNQEIKIVASKNAYIQAGTDSAKTADQVMSADTVKDRLRIKYSNDASFTRRAFLTFDLAQISSSVESVLLKMQLQNKLGKDFAKAEVYAVGDWEKSSLSWNNQPAKTATDALAVITPSNFDVISKDGICTVDVTSAVQAAISAGQTSLSLSLESPTVADQNQMDIYNLAAASDKLKPSLVATIAGSTVTESYQSISPVEVTTTVNTAPMLPNTVQATPVNSSAVVAANVVWDTIPKSQYAAAGTFTVSGKVKNSALKATATIIVVDGVVPPITELNKVEAVKAAYVQAGSDKEKTADMIMATNTGVNLGRIRVKNSDTASETGQTYTRRAYLTFDLKNMDKTLNRFNLQLQLQANLGKDFTGADVYTITDTWSSDTVSWNNQPGKSSAEKVATISNACFSSAAKDGIMTVDVSAAVMAALQAKQTTISFALQVPVQAPNNQMDFYGLASSDGNHTKPALIATNEAITHTTSVSITTSLNIAPALPQTITAVMSDGTTQKLRVTWDSVSPSDYAKICTFEVKGSLTDYPNSMYKNVTAKVKVTIPAGYKSTTYYIDSANGSDNNDGSTQAKPWQTLNKVNATAFLPGDKILLKAGSVWNGQLMPKGDGAAGKPIIIDKYGEGAKPIINGGGTTNTANSGTVMLIDQEYWEIHNLEVTNFGAGQKFGKDYSEPYVRSGILIYTTDQDDIKEHIVVKDCYVHDVVSFTGEKIASQPTATPKISGGIIAFASSQTVDLVSVVEKINNKSGFTHVVFENNTVINTMHEGIRTKVDGQRDHFKKNNSDVSISNNYIEEILGDAIVIGENSKDGRIERNIIKGAASVKLNNMYYAAVWAHYANGTLVQNNEVYGTKYGMTDGESFDADNECYDTTFQYNYSNDNNGGALLLMASQHNTIYRYNVSANDGWQKGEEIINDHSNSANNDRVPQVYNNTFYIDKNKSTNIYSGVGSGIFVNFRNNIVLTSHDADESNTLRFAKVPVKANGSIIENNCFSSEMTGSKNRTYTIEELKSKGNIFEDPMLFQAEKAAEHITNVFDIDACLNNPIETIRLRVAEAFTPKKNSPVIAAGVVIKSNELDRDILGNPIRVIPSMGAIEFKDASVVVVDKSKLAQKIKTAEAYIESNYTTATWSVFEMALNAAKAVNANKDAKQEDVTTALNNLTTAINGLKNKPDDHDDHDTSPTPTPITPKNEVQIDANRKTATVTTKSDTAPVSLNGTTTITTTIAPSTSIGSVNTVNIVLPNAEIKTAVKAENVVIEVRLPAAIAENSDSSKKIVINAAADVLQMAAQSGKKVSINVMNADTGKIAYTCTIDGSTLNKAAIAQDINIAMSVNALDSDANISKAAQSKSGLILSFSHSGSLPGPATFKVPAGNYAAGTALYLYYYNRLGMLEPVNQTCTVDVNGDVAVAISHCSQYVLLSQQTANALALDTVDPYTFGAGDEYTFLVESTSETVPTAETADSSIASVKYLKKIANGYLFQIIGLKDGATSVSVTQDGKIGAFQINVKSETVKSDTTNTFSIKNGESYVIKFTVRNNEKNPPMFFMGTRNTFSTEILEKIGNDYYFKITATGEIGSGSGIYSQLPGQMAIRQCVVNVG